MKRSPMQQKPSYLPVVADGPTDSLGLLGGEPAVDELALHDTTPLVVRAVAGLGVPCAAAGRLAALRATLGDGAGAGVVESGDALADGLVAAAS